MMKNLLLTTAALLFAAPAPAPAAPRVGDPAPLFEAPSTDGTIRLADYRGRKPVILAFYFKDFTSGWTAELKALQADLNRFEGLNAQVLGVSPDDLETHRKFSASLGLRFPLIADKDNAIRKRYAPGRITYLIDRDGIIRFIQEGMPEHEDFLRELEKLQK